MPVTVGAGVTIGAGATLGSNPFPGRLMGNFPATNTVQTWTGVNTPTTSSTPSPWIGSTSANLSSSSVVQYLKTTSPTPTFQNFGTGEFTVEFFVYVPTGITNTYHMITTTNVSGGFAIALGNANPGTNINAMFLSTQGLSQYETPAYTFAKDTWTFVVIQRKKGTGAAVTFWAGTASGGVANKLTNSGSSSLNVNYANADSTNGVTIGQYLTPSAGSAKAQFYLNEICFSNVARYNPSATSIVVPTMFYPVDSYTTQLMTFQGTNGGTTFSNITSQNK